MSDQQAIQGLWRVVSLVSRGEPVLSATTHYQFDGNRVKAIDDAALGRLTWEDNFDYWEASVALAGGPRAQVQIDVGADQGDAAAIAAGRAFVDWLRAHEPEARAYAASLMLDGYNDNWSDDEQLTVAEFAARLSLETAGLSPDGEATLFYADGNMFGGHVVIVSLDANRTFTDANIAG